ncbi:uncharacterized protein AKAW2_40439A [Aspergillus luchuensis]|uniref:Uncharacterized protein n=1 Tax=Aspergillus kawachii TaxID=1069201 RepID=A0A7R7W9A3_ASPKA|nr:uncharacterized protein AKAW2_40439A [Aspergillus luchuensis]BCR98756.1 hypothetical protein AKAW2_40439A [Aspergillus luchuensis]
MQGTSSPTHQCMPVPQHNGAGSIQIPWSYSTAVLMPEIPRSPCALSDPPELMLSGIFPSSQYSGSSYLHQNLFTS